MIRLLAPFVLFGCMTLVACTSEGAGDRPAGGSAAVPERLNPEQVPADLRHLTGLAEKWGIGDDVDRIAKVDAATPAEREELSRAIAPHHSRITEWLNAFGEGEMTDEAAAFMYTQLALDEMMIKPTGPDSLR